MIVTLSCLLVKTWAGLIEAGNSWPQQRLHNSHFPILKWIKTVWDLGTVQQAFVCLCIPRWLDQSSLPLPLILINTPEVMGNLIWLYRPRMTLYHLVKFTYLGSATLHDHKEGRWERYCKYIDKNCFSYWADPGEARGCSTNIFVIHSLIK